MRVLVLANSGMGLYKFRKEILEQLIAFHDEVYVSFPINEYIPKFLELGCNYIESSFDRRGKNPITDIKLILSYIKMIKEVEPEIVLTFTIKPNIYGGMACRFTKTPYIANVTGLGTSIEHRGILQKFVMNLYKIGLKKAKCVFFENTTNRQLFINRKIVRHRSKVVPGAGVNLEQHDLEEYPENDDIIKFLFIGRIMKEKGIDELFLAAANVKKIYPNVVFDIVGPLEDGYEYYQNQIEELSGKEMIHFHGLVDNVHLYIKDSHATILPSYHEGTSNVLLESASTGRPILASNIPGCRETFDEGCSGLGFEVKNAKQLQETIIKFIELPYETKKQMGLAARKKMEREYDRSIVVNAYLEEINRFKMKSTRIIF